MERLWSPWRHDYIANTNPEKFQGCIFCAAQQNPANDEENLVLYRGTHNFVILNRYPYISGHLMVAPFAHIGELDSAPKQTTDELMDIVKRCQTALGEAYSPQGFNIGMNLGRVAGAGFDSHFHMHIMPRWAGDTNFLTTVGETRVIPEDLRVTYDKLRGRL